jgi:hypothetical protein
MSAYYLMVYDNDDGTNIGKITGPVPQKGDRVVIYSKKLQNAQQRQHFEPFIGRVHSVDWEADFNGDEEVPEMQVNVYVEEEGPIAPKLYCTCILPAPCEDRPDHCDDCGDLIP